MIKFKKILTSPLMIIVGGLAGFFLAILFAFAFSPSFAHPEGKTSFKALLAILSFFFIPPGLLYGGSIWRRMKTNPESRIRDFSLALKSVKDFLLFLGGAAFILYALTVSWFLLKGAYIAVSGKGKCLHYKKVFKVGGCDAFGNCGVSFSDGSTGTLNKPVQEQVICVERSWKEPETGP